MKSFYLPFLFLWITSGVVAQNTYTSLSADAFLTTGSARSAGTDCFQLTAAVNWQGGTLWYKDPIDLNEPFEMEMKLSFGCDDAGADGMVFIFHPRLRDGYQGEGIGFGGLNPALGIEMDTYENPHLNDPSFDHLALLKNGQMHHGAAITKAVPLLYNKKNIEDCKAHQVKITWQPATKTLQVSIDGRLTLDTQYDIVRDIFRGRSKVYWGISAATGGEFNQHKICLEKLIFNTPDAFDFLTKKQLLDGNEYTLKNVDFLSGNASLASYSSSELSKLVALLKDNPKLDIYISGHTDDIGSAQRNKTLSRKRAEAVADFLIKNGIEKDRIKSTGFGENYPKVSNSSPENRKINRRVDVRLVLPRA